MLGFPKQTQRFSDCFFEGQNQENIVFSPKILAMALKKVSEHAMRKCNHQPRSCYFSHKKSVEVPFLD